MPPPIAAPVAAPTSVYSRCSSVKPQADTIPRMATHIRYVPNFLRTLSSLLARHYSPVSGSGLIETKKQNSDKIELTGSVAEHRDCDLARLDPPTRSHRSD